MSFVFAANKAKDVPDDVAAAVAAKWRTFSPVVKKNSSLSITDLSQPTVATRAVAPVLPQANPTPTEESSNNEIGTLELTDEYLDLIEIELNKLNGKTIAECKPLIANLAKNPDLHIDFRLAYLDRIVNDEDDVFQKGLQEHVRDVREELVPTVADA